MTQDEFQSAVLAFIKDQKKFNEQVASQIGNLDAGVKDLQRFAVEQTEFNNEMKEFRAETKKAFDEQDRFNNKMEFLFGELVQGLNRTKDESKDYTDERIQDHEERYQHIPATA